MLGAVTSSLSACYLKGSGDENDETSGNGGTSGNDEASSDDDGDGFTADLDCDDTDPAVNPDATEVCDGADNNCDGLVDDDDPALDSTSGSVWYADSDGDGYGVVESTMEACVEPDGYADAGGDCDDGEATVNPGAIEVCDELDVDEDCSGTADDEDPGVDPTTATAYFPDADGDGFGDSAAAGRELCEDPSTAETAWLPDNSDCDDGDSAVNPDATEVCDELDVDEDCSGAADNADPGADVASQSLFYTDADGDGYGDLDDTGSLYCDAEAGISADNTDCDDSSADVNPGATEVCDELDVDEDCSGSADDADAGVDSSTFVTYYVDDDSDGYGDTTSAGSSSCDAPLGWVADNTDCDDLDDAINPGATEVCDGVDNDCNSSTSEDGLATFVDSIAVVTDYTSTLSGSSASPATATLSTDGELALCSGIWYVNLSLAADVDLYNPSGVPSDVMLDGAAAGSVITVTTDGIDVYLEGLTIQNGDGTGASDAGLGAVNGGGIDCFATGTSISATTVNIEANTAGGSGGGIGVNGCDLTLDDMVIADNTAFYGGGIVLNNGNLVFSNSVVSDNTGSSNGGGFDLHDTDGSVTVELDEVEVRDNASGGYGGGMNLESQGDGVSVRCIGSTTTNAGFTGNTAGIAGGAFSMLGLGAGDFESDTCDFGTSAGGDDNNPDDIWSYTASDTYSKGDNASFICTGGMCPTAVEHPIGGTGDTFTDSNFYMANIVLADAAVELDSFTVTASSSSSACLLDFYVMSNTSASGSGWTIEWADLGGTLTSSLAEVQSGSIGITTTVGTYYALVMGTTCSSTGMAFDYSFAISPSDAGFGTLQGYIYDNAYRSTFAVGDTDNAEFFSSSASYSSVVMVVE